METLGSRIARLRKDRALSQTDLANLCGWENGQARVGNYERDKREPSLSDLRTIAQALGVSLMELIEGQTVHGTAESGAEYGFQPAAHDYALVPQYTACGACGPGQLNEHVEVKGGLAFKRAWLQRMGLRERNLHVIYVQGHSMEPRICDADVVLLDESQTEPKSGRVYAILRPDGELIIKRLIQTITNGWLIRSDNDDKLRYPDEIIAASEIGHLQIIGRVVWHGGAV